ncbi:MAG: HNH endonuclease [Candidatus Sericytochromatia bacterium]|nr:HNH endonuclease [Candidatus Sericytochromatia bacterium]
MTENPFQLGLLELPESPDLGIRHLSAVFRHTTNSYKFYWFLAILEAVKNGLNEVSLDLLTAEMLAQVWYPVHYFHLNFGKLDRLGQLALQLKEKKYLPIQTKREEVRDAALSLMVLDKEFRRDFINLQRYVPTRFLSPWFGVELQGIQKDPRTQAIKEQAENTFESSAAPLYRFVERPHFKGIEIHTDWMDYLSSNFRIIRGFTLWSLLNYLQQRNPHVPNLQEKFFPPEERNLNQAKEYWGSILKKEKLFCPFSGHPIPIKGYSIDHFLPWSFIGHDQIWNLFPISKSVNSSKSDKLPRLSKYLEPFTVQQYQAMQVFLTQSDTKRPKALDDYINLFRCDYETLKSLPLERFVTHFRDTFVPLEQMAANMGFIRNWEF